MFALIQADLRRFSEVLRGEDAPGFSRRVRDFLSPRFAPVLLYRIAFALQAAHLGPLAKMVSLVNFIFFGALSAAHAGNGNRRGFDRPQRHNISGRHDWRTRV
jgi:hypothetical protein